MTPVIISRKWISKPYEDFENRFESRHIMSVNHHRYRRNHHLWWQNKIKVSNFIFPYLFIYLFYIYLFLFNYLCLFYFYYYYILFLFYFSFVLQPSPWIPSWIPDTTSSTTPTHRPWMPSPPPDTITTLPLSLHHKSNQPSSFPQPAINPCNLKHWPSNPHSPCPALCHHNHHHRTAASQTRHYPLHLTFITCNYTNHGSHLKFTSPPFNHPSTQYPQGTITARAQNQLQPIHLKASSKSEPISNRRRPKRKKNKKKQQPSSSSPGYPPPFTSQAAPSPIPAVPS
jgi:hypothetical protein